MTLHKYPHRWMVVHRGLPDRGALSLELALLGPVFLIFLALMVGAGRIYLSGSTVDDAARDAARAASLQNNPTTARALALQVAKAAMAARGLHCRSTDIQIPTAAFSTPPGQPAALTVTVTCRVDLSDIAVPGMPGVKTLTGSFTTALDQYRQRATSLLQSAVLPVVHLPVGGPDA